MAHVIPLVSGAFMSGLSVKGRIKSWEAHKCNQQFGENENTDIGKSQRLQKESNARINQVSAMRLGLAKIIEKIRILRHFERPETDCHTAEIACWIDYADNWLSKIVHQLSKSESTNCSTTYSGCENCRYGFECGHHVGWFRVESGGAACTLVLVYVSIRLSESQSV